MFSNLILKKINHIKFKYPTINSIHIGYSNKEIYYFNFKYNSLDADLISEAEIKKLKKNRSLKFLFNYYTNNLTKGILIINLKEKTCYYDRS